MEKLTRLLLAIFFVVAINSIASAWPVWTAGGSGGSGGGGVTSLNSLTGALSLTSTGSTVTITPSGSTINLEASGGSSVSFSALTSGTNTSAAMVIGTGSSLFASGAGAIGATAVPVTGVTGLGIGMATFLATPSSANLAATVTNETGTGALVFGTAPTITLGNGTGLPLATGVTGTLQAANFPALTGDITTPGGALATTLATVNSNVGTFGGVTFNGKGLATAAISQSSHNSVRVATAVPLTITYSNGSSGVGATLTNAGTQTATFIIDNTTLAVNDRVLVWLQNSNTFQNGIYIVTSTGSVSTNWVMTRASDFDNSTAGNVAEGVHVVVEEGNTYPAALFIETGAGPFTVGTTPIVFTENAAGSVTGGFVASVSNSDTTITCSPNTGTVVCSTNLARANTWTANAGASAPAVTFSGTSFSGNGTTSTPIVYINNGATPPTSWNTAGTQFGINMASGFNGLIMDVHPNGGSSVFTLSANGNVVAGQVNPTAVVASGQISTNKAGAASSSSLQTTGVLLTAGTPTTTFPQWFANTSGNSAVTAWSSGSNNGTYIGVNSLSTFTGDYISFHASSNTQLFEVAATGQITDNAGAAFVGNISSAQSSNTLQVLTPGTTVSWNMNSGADATLAPAQNFTLNNPTNIIAGTNYMITITQDATGSRVITWGSAYKFPGGTKFILSTGANLIDTIACYAPNTSVLECVGQANFQ